MKLKVDKKAYDSMDELLKAHYVEDAEGVYVLDIEDMPTPEPQRDDGPLKRAHERKKQELQEALAKLKAYEEKQASTSMDDARKNGDLETMEKAYQSNMEKLRSELTDQNNKLKDNYKKQLVDNVAIKLANELTDSPDLILPHIKQRLKADFDGDSPSTVFLDQFGNPTPMAETDFKKDFMDNPSFAPIIRGNKANGGGANNSNKNFSSDATNSKNKKFSEMNAAEMGAYERSDPEGFKADYAKRFGT